MAQVHHHPDGLIYVRTANGTYCETPEHFTLDHGSAFPALPEGCIERIYDPADRHVLTSVSHEQVAQPLPWPEGDAIIAAYPMLVSAKIQRLSASS